MDRPTAARDPTDMELPLDQHDSPATDLRPTIVVGIDGSHAATSALRWAVVEAAALDATIRLVDVVAPEATTRAHRTRLARKALRAAKNVAEGFRPPDDVETILRFGSAYRALVDESRGAAMLCIGVPDRPPGMPMPALAATLAAHAYCSVAVIRDTGGSDGVITVVLDDDDDNDDVVGEAMRQGRIRRTTVRQIDRRRDSWVRRFPDVRVELVAAGTGPSIGRTARGAGTPVLAVVGQSDGARVDGLVTPNCHPIVGYPDCSVLFVRSEPGG